MRVIVMSGASGSGKSTYIKTMVEKDETWSPRTVVSADNYFIRDGKYVFDASKLSEAHGTCFREFIEAMRIRCPLVVVDNTNTTSEEISPYMLGAQAFGYEAEIITLRNVADNYALILLERRNLHGVRAGNIYHQLDRLSKRKLLPWWKNTDITSEP